jgi:hypothetical protein
MSAAAVTDAANKISEMFQKHTTEYLESGDTSRAKYRLTFTMDTKQYSTVFIVKDNKFTNNCVTLEDFEYFSSDLSANSDEKGCFTPTLSDKKNLPAGVSQTDILMVLSTKLNFLATPDADSLDIYDVAKLMNPTTGDTYTAFFSHWRLLRDEPTLYEKYGYANPVHDEIRDAVRTTLWDEIKDQVAIAERFHTPAGAPIFVPGKTIAECMKQVSYADTESVLVSGSNSTETIVDVIFNALIAIEKISMDDFMATHDLTLDRDSDVWKRWDARLRFVTFEPVLKGGAAKSRRRRQPRRRQKTRRNSKKI